MSSGFLTSISPSVLPSGRSGSVTVTSIGPSVSSPGVTIISPVSGSIFAGTSFPSLSLADTSVSSSLFSILTPVPWSSPFGSTGLLFESSTVVLSAGLESGSFGSVSFSFSTSSGTPSPSSSSSVLSAIPSPSVSLRTVIFAVTSFVSAFSPSPLVTVTLTSISLSSSTSVPASVSAAFQSVIFGVPTIVLFLGSSFNQDGRSLASIVASFLFGLITMPLIASPSVTSCVSGSIVADSLSASLGFLSSSSLMPSLSSSSSVTSGMPSPSVSLWIVTVISFVDLFPDSSTALIVAVTVFSSSSPQSSDFSTFPSICFVSSL